MRPILPDVLLIGPMKAGTTWVHDYLAWRGDVCLPHGTKETFFFDRYFDNGIEWYAEHYRHFDPAVHRAKVEIAPSYFASQHVRERVKMTLRPKLFLACVRHPVSRSWSHYVHLRRYGYARGSLEETLTAHPEIIEASRYSKQLGAWTKLFPESRLDLFFLDDLKADRIAFIRRICEKLEIPFKPVPPSLEKAANQAAVSPSRSFAGMSRRVSRILRGRRMYGLIEHGKKLGLHRLAYGASESGVVAPKPSVAELALLQTTLSDEIKYVGHLVNKQEESCGFGRMGAAL